MSNNIDRKNGGGPWLLELDEDLEPDDFEVFNLESMTYNGRKGYFRPWLPVDTVQIKNLDTSNPVKATFNGQFDTIVEPNAAVTYGDVDSIRFRLENVGGSTLEADDLIIQITVEPFDADDRALEEAQRHPLEKLGRSVLGL